MCFMVLRSITDKTVTFDPFFAFFFSKLLVTIQADPQLAALSESSYMKKFEILWEKKMVQEAINKAPFEGAGDHRIVNLNGMKISLIFLK